MRSERKCIVYQDDLHHHLSQCLILMMSQTRPYTISLILFMAIVFRNTWMFVVVFGVCRISRDYHKYYLSRREKKLEKTETFIFLIQKNDWVKNIGIHLARWECYRKCRTKVQTAVKKKCIVEIGMKWKGVEWITISWSVELPLLSMFWMIFLSESNKSATISILFNVSENTIAEDCRLGVEWLIMRCFKCPFPVRIYKK